MQERDTIISLATVAGESAIGVIRISGDKCLELSDDIFNTPCPTPRKSILKNYKSLDNKILDHVLFVYFEDGKSFTGEQTIEISFHGNTIIANQILDDLIKRNCRLAEPGEYTRRAYLNGKIDLTQAESVAEVISATSEVEVDIANQQLKGRLSDVILKLQTTLINLQANFEAIIDFPEDHLEDPDLTNSLNTILQIKSSIEDLIETFRLRSYLSNGIKIPLIGPPNVGKSSIFNKLLRENRTIVSAQPGTTRDYISKELITSGYKIELFDSAGIRHTDNELELDGIQNSIKLIDDSTIILLVLDSSLPYPADFFTLIKNSIQGKHIIIIENKSDLERKIKKVDYPIHNNILKTSVFEKNCANKIFNEINSFLETRFTNNPLGNILINKRHYLLLKETQSHLCLLENLVKDNVHEEFILQELKLSLTPINEIIGSKDNEDMLDELFKNFCIGK
ncbi:MAG: tRNA uridine-5-carboxymethylaminomethyl(34) synthesis GTPase MnmE [Opitutales bacterium]